MEYSISNFLTYFGTWYPVIIPATVGFIVLLATLLDWCRIGIMGYADDFETTIDLYIVPLLRRIIFSEDGTGKIRGRATDTRNGDAWGNLGDLRKSGSEYYVSTHSYWDTIKCSNKLDAEVISKRLKRLAVTGGTRAFVRGLRDGENCSPSLIFALGVILFGILAVLGAYSVFPVVTIAIASGYFTLRLTRSVVRLTKKFKSHVTDPEAHGAKEYNNGGTGPR